MLKKNNYPFYKEFPAVIIFLATVFIFLQSPVIAQNNIADSLKGITIHQEIDFNVSPKRLYETLLSSKQFSDCTKKSFGVFSATSASIDAAAGGSFSVFDGHIAGRIVELVPNERIVEAWRVGDWPAGVYSIAKFELKAQGSGTHLIFDHTGFPAGLKEHLTIGWQQHYWDALIKYFQ
jgi:activator of HSP90 ATPase